MDGKSFYSIQFKSFKSFNLLSSNTHWFEKSHEIMFGVKMWKFINFMIIQLYKWLTSVSRNDNRKSQ